MKLCNPKAQNQLKINPLQFGNDENSLIEVNLLVSLTSQPYFFLDKLLKYQYSKLYTQNKLIKPLEIDKNENLDGQDLTKTSNQDNEGSTLDILKEFGLIGCISAEPDLSTNYKSVLREELDCKYDHR